MEDQFRNKTFIGEFTNLYIIDNATSPSKFGDKVMSFNGFMMMYDQTGMKKTDFLKDNEGRYVFLKANN